MKILVPALFAGYLLWRGCTTGAVAAALTAMALGYLAGSIPFGFLAGRLFSADIRTKGSGNIGTANALRVLGKAPGAAVLILDLLKGTLACWLAYRLPELLPGNEFASDPELPYRLTIFAGYAAILGHNYTCWLGFKGGKGIATSVGVFLYVAPSSLLVALITFLFLAAITRTVSVGSLGASAMLPYSVWCRASSPGILQEFALAIGLLAVYRHRTNIKRLWAGEESRIGQKEKPS